MISEYAPETSRYQIRLDDGTVIRDNAAHCICPVAEAGDYVGFAKAGPGCKFSVYKKSTKAHSDLVVTAAGGEQFGATDGRCLVMAQRIAQGKNDSPLDLIAVIFDTQTEKFLNFSALPTLQVFRAVGAGQKPNALWIQNGRQVSGFEGSDPQGIVREVSFPQPNIIRWILAQPDSNGITVKRIQCERTIDLATGALGPITQVIS